MQLARRESMCPGHAPDNRTGFHQVKTCTPSRWMMGLIVCTCLASQVTAQVGYTFTSGPSGDGFTWPASPTGLLGGDYYETPDGVEFDNFCSNNLFFDSQYLVAGNASGISTDAMWCNPIDDGFPTIDVYLYNYGLAQSVEFFLAWSAVGSPGTTPDFVYIYLEDPNGYATDEFFFLDETFSGLSGPGTGEAGQIQIFAAGLIDSGSGNPFSGISYLSIYVGDVSGSGPSSEVAIDNFSVDGGSTGSGELYPSVNNGAIDVTNSILARTFLRGVGMATASLEVTNGTSSATTYSTVLLPGSGLADGGQVMGAPISAGQTVSTGTIATLDRTLPSGEYDGDFVVVNDGNPSDPDNDVTLRIRLFDEPLLTAPSPVDVTAGQDVELSNAAAVTNGFRASVKVTAATTTGPFSVTGFALDTPVKPDQTETGIPSFDRFGRLSGSYGGSFTVSLDMTAYVGTNEDFEVFLAGALPVPDVAWTLDATLLDILNDSLAFGVGEDLGPGELGVNTAQTAATILEGTTSVAESVMLDLAAGAGGITTGIIADQAMSDFSGVVPAHVMQLTYRDQDICGDLIEGNLELLRYNSGTGDWESAILGNSDSGSGASFYSGSFADFAATLGGAPLSSALSTYGLDSTNNHIWAVLDVEGTFGIGEPGEICTNPADCDSSGSVDLADYESMQSCLAGPDNGIAGGCDCFDFDLDGDVTVVDYGLFQTYLKN
jgi:hypothetical protein